MAKPCPASPGGTWDGGLGLAVAGGTASAAIPHPAGVASGRVHTSPLHSPTKANPPSPPPLITKLPTAAAPRGMLGDTKPRARWEPRVATCCRADVAPAEQPVVGQVAAVPGRTGTLR